MTALERQLDNHRLTTAEILYHMPDHPALLQSYLWQDYDRAPHFPALHRFLDYWEQNLEGRLHSVQVANVPLLRVPTWRMAKACLTLH
ncbi:MAG: Usg family protein [Pseudomonadota bacterium]